MPAQTQRSQRNTVSRSQAANAAVRRAGLLPLRFHDLRHTFAAFLIHEGANAKQIMALMGHSSIRVTFDRYGHLFEGHDEPIIQGLDNALRAAHFSRTLMDDRGKDRKRTKVFTRPFVERTTGFEPATLTLAR